MLEHVIKAEILDLVFGGVDLFVGVLKVALNDKGGRVPRLACASMVRAGIPAFCQDIGNVTVGCDDLLDEFSEVGVNTESC